MYFISRIPKRAILFVAALALMTAVFYGMSQTPLGQEFLSVSVALSSDSDAARGEFLASYGWEVTTVPEEIAEVTIPGEFNQVYTRYNDMQLAQGFDLRPYRGKTVKRYTYAVHNYPDTNQQVHANLLIYKGEVIGGDLCTYAIDGFMHGFSLEETGVLQQTFYEMVMA